MRRSWFPILLVIGLLGLLVLLATLQYRWLGQISDAERERLQRTVEADTARFAEDFNREIHNAYFNFQLEPENWKRRNWTEFNQRYDFYREKAAYPNLIKDFYFIELRGDAPFLRYDPEKRAFVTAEWNDEIGKLKQKLINERNFQPINESLPALLMPIHELNENFSDILGGADLQPKTLVMRRYATLVLVLDKTVLENQIFSDLIEKYFNNSRDGNYKLAVVNQNNQSVFQTAEVNVPDARAKIFNLVPDKFTFFENRRTLPLVSSEKRESFVLSQIESKELRGKNEVDGNAKFDVKILQRQPLETGEGSRLRIFESQNIDPEGVWTLQVQHTAGSLEQFVANTRNRNLAVSFGILSLLAVSIILIFLSAQRAKLLAQRQMDFVSAVSHEFRTPLAVIYSAGENLSDGVIREENKIANYGNLIKREGKKLSAMVEQILEFAGARSGKRRYDFRETDVKKIIEEAIAECQPLIEEKDFTIEMEIAENLPPISADEKALTQAVQNLIANALKYGDGSKWLKVSARNGDNKIKIAVEDRGIGIDKKEIGKVFEPFYRSKKVVDEQIHGNGLGLSLVKQIIEAHGGKIDVESEIGKGSKFTIELMQKEN